MKTILLAGLMAMSISGTGHADETMPFKVPPFSIRTNDPAHTDPGYWTTEESMSVGWPGTPQRTQVPHRDIPEPNYGVQMDRGGVQRAYWRYGDDGMSCRVEYVPRAHTSIINAMYSFCEPWHWLQ